MATNQTQELLQAETPELTTTLVWNTMQDEVVCPVCGPLEGAPKGEWGGQFPDGPPAHPNCRCSTSIRFDAPEQLEAEFATRQAEREAWLREQGLLPAEAPSIGQPTFTDYQEAVNLTRQTLPLGPTVDMIDEDEMILRSDITEESAAVFSYTGAGSRGLNRELREGTLEQYEGLTKLANDLDAALSKLPKYEGMVYRGLRFDNEGQRSTFMLDLIHSSDKGPVVFRDFASSSVLEDKAREFSGMRRGILMHIKSKNGRVLGVYSRYSGTAEKGDEEEVLFGRDSLFTMTNFDKDREGLVHVFLEEYIE